MKYRLTFLTFIFWTVCLAQRTFHIDSSFLDSIDYNKYKVFVVSKELEIDFIVRKIPINDRYTIQISEAKAANYAIQNQYAEAEINQLDKQNNYNNYDTVNFEKAELKKVFKLYKERRPQIVHRLKNDQKRKIKNFDRYFWGYKNADDEKLILIRFDPHRVSHYSIGGETFDYDLPIMVYNLNKNMLSVAGWSDFKE